VGLKAKPTRIGRGTRKQSTGTTSFGMAKGELKKWGLAPWNPMTHRGGKRFGPPGEQNRKRKRLDRCTKVPRSSSSGGGQGLQPVPGKSQMAQVSWVTE